MQQGALAALRASARAQCDASRLLCARAGAVRTRSGELRRLTAQQSQAWRRWRQLQRRVTQGGGPERPILRVCMDCARVYAALPLARSEGEADAAWRAVPVWVRERLRAGALSVVPSHGICPGCARARGWGED